MATNPLRDAVATKYGGTTSSVATTNTEKTPVINPVRQSVTDKYTVREPAPITQDGTALEPSRSPTSSPVSTTKTLRQQIAERYATPAPNSYVAKEEEKRIAQKTKEQGAIASPEYFSNSVDVRSESGKFLKTFTGTKPGEAESAAKDYAIEKGGFIQVTPPAGVFGRIFTRAQEAFKGALDAYVEKGLNFGKKLDNTNPDNSRLARAASGVDFAVSGINVLLSPISAAFSAAEEVPVVGVPAQGINYIFGKAGEAGGWVANEAVDALPISDKAKEEVRPAAENLSVLLAQLATGKLGAKGTSFATRRTAILRDKIKTTITKDVIETNQLPRTIFVSAEKVKDIFQTGEKISPEELELIQSLGLTAEGYKAAIKDGVSISIPSERITQIVDKPWFARVKEAFGVEPFSERIVNTSGKPVKGPEIREERLLNEGKVNSTPGAIQPVKTRVETVLSEPITNRLLDTIDRFTPAESAAFGKKIVDTINEAIGTKIPEGAARLLPSNVDLVETPSGDGRPAQFKNGRIELFLPDLLGDLKTLSEGKQILAHEGEFSTVYKKKADESMEDLAVRYVRDIVLHEASHQKTMTLTDAETIRTLQRDLNAAKIANNKQGTIDAREKLTKFMASLETKANAYMRENYETLEKEFFGGKRETSTEIQRRINKTVDRKIPSREKIETTEKKSLIQRIKSRAQGAREGFSAGRKQGQVEAKAETASRFEVAIQKINSRNATVAERKKIAIDYAQILPFRERSKFIKAINNISSKKEFLDVLARIQKASRSTERKTLITEIAKELKGTIVKKKSGIPNAKFALEAQRTLNQMRTLQKTLTYQEAQIKIANKISNWQTENPDAAIPVDLLREVEVLKTVGIKDQTVAELSYTLSAIQSLKETGRTKKEIEIFNRETEVQQKKDTIYDVITGGEPLPSEKLSIKTRESRAGVVQQIKQFFTTQQYGFEEVLDVLSFKDKTSKPYESFLSRYAGDKASDAFNAQNRGELKQIEAINTGMKEAYGFKKNTDVMIELQALKEVRELGDFVHLDGKTRTLQLSRGEAIQYHMWLQDETLLDTFKETLLWTPEIIDAVTQSLTPKDIKMANFLIDDFYPKYYESINKAYNRDYGVDLPFNPNYSPVHRAVDVSIPENVLLAQESAKYATAKNGSLKDRQKSRLDLKATDALENVMRHIAKMEHYKAWSESMFEFRRIFGDKEVRQAITDIHGREYMKVLDNFLNDFARDGVAREKVVKAVDQLRINTTRALLGFNLNVGIKQLTGVMNYGIEIPLKDLFTGIGDFWTDPLKKSRFLYEKSDTLQERFGEGYERDIKFAIQRGYDKRLAKANNLNEALFIIIRNADKFTVYQGAWAAYRNAYTAAKKAGKSEVEAEKLGIRSAENITNRVQETSRLDTLSPIQRGGSMAKLFTMLAGQPNKYLRIIMNAGRNYKAGRQSKATAAKRIVWAWFIVPFIYNLIAEQLIDEEYRSGTGGLVMKTLLGPLSYPLVTGQMFQSIYGWTQGERFGYQASPVESFANDIQKAIAEFNKEDAVDAITYMLDAAGKLGGIPSTIITRPIRKANKDAGNSGGGAEASF